MSATGFEHLAPTRIVFARGALERVGAYAGEFGGRALVVCGRSAMREHGVLDRVLASLRAHGVAGVVHDAISPDPKAHEIDRALARLERERCQAIVGLGGGSALDAAKAIGVAAARGSVAELIGATLAPSRSALPVIAVPTTTGSGAEVTRGAIVTDVKRRFKSGIRGDDVFPRVAIVDPQLARTQPPPVAAETGFDALTHAIETYLARKASPLTEICSERAIALLARNLPRLAAGRFGREEQDALSFAALLGGLTVANASTCLPHRLQQAMGAVTRVSASHGRGLAALYPAWLERALPFAVERCERLALLLSGERDLLAAVAQLRELLGLTATLTDLGFVETDVEDCLDALSGNVENDPIDGIDRELMRAIYERSL
jgi:alcohol dehydrogenase class IV